MSVGKQRSFKCGTEGAKYVLSSLGLLLNRGPFGEQNETALN